MIIMEQKPLEEILKMLERVDNVLIVGCNGCAGIYQVGGEKQAEIMKILIGMAVKLKQNREIKTKSCAVLRQCDSQIAATSLRPIVEDYEAILSLACGVGVQTVAQLFENKLVIPANNTKFIGMQDRELGKFYELCSACGECILFETGGICPVTRCGKSLLNGPCGGQALGKCEVGGWKKDCAWVLIYNRLKEKNMLEYFTKFREPRDFRIRQGPREMGGE
ncbi:methylenetetrahydrofolate reductase C-terminal domain-containing protein [Candidatus Bathyarchaeota archaeon]|nr:methylenetetrahydrofolate reductase C-terminal domain-containing protein [Candidatus Bathyarchaeota archaeon]